MFAPLIIDFLKLVLKLCLKIQGVQKDTKYTLSPTLQN